MSGSDGWYERALVDEDLAGVIADAYSGRHSLLDALWWHDHPFDPAPSGTPSPAEHLRMLQRSVYAKIPGDTDTDRATATSTLLELEALLAEDRLRLADALAAGTRHLARGRGSPVSLPLTPQPSDATGATHLDVQPVQGQPPRNRPVAVAVVISAALILGVIIGVAITGIRGTDDGAGRSGATATDAADSDGAEAPSASELGALAIFDGPVADSVPPVLLTDRFNWQSFRVLVDDQNGRVLVYAARDSSGRLCMAAPSTNDSYASACTTPTDFPRSGLTLRTVVDMASEDDDAVDAGTADLEVVWRADGSLSWSRILRD